MDVFPAQLIRQCLLVDDDIKPIVAVSNRGRIIPISLEASENADWVFVLLRQLQALCGLGDVGVGGIFVCVGAGACENNVVAFVFV